MPSKHREPLTSQRSATCSAMPLLHTASRTPTLFARSFGIQVKPQCYHMTPYSVQNDSIVTWNCDISVGTVTGPLDERSVL